MCCVESYHHHQHVLASQLVTQRETDTDIVNIIDVVMFPEDEDTQTLCSVPRPCSFPGHTLVSIIYVDSLGVCPLVCCVPLLITSVHHHTHRHRQRQCRALSYCRWPPTNLQHSR